ncbi:LLM class flavin-dependent oxidoreductase [Streptomyces triculaminicus]|uniref:LLM class flavin-dependent oxidoreductase n=1 Tax=Streptomyces triculaminicus TaxID=2816232 RepID=UPI003F4D4982
MPEPTRPLHLAVALDRPGAHDAGPYIRAARLAERGRLDFVTLGDSFAPPRRGAGRPDAVAALARVAPATERIGLVPTVTTTHTEPFHVSSALSTLDRVSRGRAGWNVAVSTGEAEARHFGRRPAPTARAAWREADAVADVVARPPQGRPVIAVEATAEPSREAAARHADVVFVRAEHAGDARRVRAVRDDLRRRARDHGRDVAGAGRIVVLASLPVALYASADAVALADLVGDWYADGVADGFHFRPRDLDRDLALLVDGTVPVLQHRGLLRTFYPGGTLREHLCLPRQPLPPCEEDDMTPRQPGRPVAKGRPA